MPVTLVVDPAGVAHITLDRASKRNALDRAMIEELLDRISELRCRDDVRAVVVRGAGANFSAGADISDWVAPPHQVAVDNSELGQSAFAALSALPVASVAVIEGTALGGGLELALACDIRVAAQDAKLGLPELGLGNLPSWGGMARIVDIAGLGVARHLLLTGELISGARAAELRLVSSAHSQSELDAAVDAVVARLLAAEPTAVRLTKQCLSGLESVIRSESALAGYTAGLESSRARKKAFLDRKAAARQEKSDVPMSSANCTEPADTAKSTGGTVK